MWNRTPTHTHIIHRRSTLRLYTTQHPHDGHYLLCNPFRLCPSGAGIKSPEICQSTSTSPIGAESIESPVPVRSGGLSPRGTWGAERTESYQSLGYLGTKGLSTPTSRKGVREAKRAGARKTGPLTTLLEKLGNQGRFLKVYVQGGGLKGTLSINISIATRYRYRKHSSILTRFKLINPMNSPMAGVFQPVAPVV